MNKHNKPTLIKLEQILKEMDYILRYEKGNFASGYCIVENKKVVVINKFFDISGRVNIILEILEIMLDNDQILSDKSKQFYRNLLKTNETAIKFNI
ncbi:MAG: hypothetical protein H7X99_03200 [Saprospiraceae bacterium]|nr:hypothetical protein [Saprospiraceae bacterium]